MLKAGFDFQEKESYQTSQDREVWLKSEAQLDELWRKRVKNDWLRLKLGGKDDRTIAETLDQRYGKELTRISRVKSDDVFGTFMNAHTMAIEPHTNYMGPQAADEFDISMKLSLVGIGASLEDKDGFKMVRELLPGRPAAVSGALKIGDRILGVAQGEGGVMTDKGPVMQERDAEGTIVTLESDRKPDAVWDGPLGVLIDRGSASASEIFAAAIQDYGRGVVIGEQSFGKGTVQAMIDLDQIAKTDKPKFGELKLTVAQFFRIFRIKGGTKQLRGVTPDILFPSDYDAATFGESSYSNALPWVQVKAANYSPLGDVKLLLPILQKRHETRVKNDQDYKDLQNDLAEINRQRKRNLVSLNEDERRRERAAMEARLSSRGASISIHEPVLANEDGQQPWPARAAGLRDDGLQAEEHTLADELEAERAGRHATDALLNEAVQILSDEADLLKFESRVAGRAGFGHTYH